MQKKVLLSFVILILFFSFLPKVFAGASSTIESINAEMLSDIWYSTTTVNENDDIDIYAGFQNHSDKSLSGTAGFFIDNLQISKVGFLADPKSLIKLETKYTATKGEHTAQVKVLDIVETGGDIVNKLSIENLLAKESGKNIFSVKHEVTKEEVINNVKESANNVLKTIDTKAEALAGYLESLKEPVGATLLNIKTSSQTEPTKSKGKVLGISNKNTSDIQASSTNKNFSFHNIFLNSLAFIIRHWIWTMSVVIVFVLYISFR